MLGCDVTVVGERLSIGSGCKARGGSKTVKAVAAELLEPDTWIVQVSGISQ